MSSLWRRWLTLILFVAVVAVVFVNLGNWQLDRLDQRRDRNANVEAHEAAPVRPWGEVFTGREITEADQWQRVEVTGTFLADRQLQARYRSANGATGWELVTPLVASDGRTVLVDRGFVPRPQAEDFPKTLPAPPAGEVAIVGYVRRNEQGKETATTVNEGTVRLINSDAIAGWLGRPLVNGYISVVEITPAQSPELQPVQPPPLTEGPHLSYALQWFAFTVIAVIGLGVLLRNDLRDRKRAQERRAAAAAGSVPSGSAAATDADAPDGGTPA